MEFLFQNLFLYFSTWFGFGFGFDLGLGFTETFWFGFGFCQNRKSGFVRSLQHTVFENRRKVSFYNTASEASYVYILSGQNLWRGLENLKLGIKQFYGLLNLQTEVVKNIHQELAHVGKVFRLPQICRGSS